MESAFSAPNIPPCPSGDKLGLLNLEMLTAAPYKLIHSGGGVIPIIYYIPI